MATDEVPNQDALARLSALMDGEDDAVRPCAEWRDSAEVRASWHAYHLIGDVLRSEDLACCASVDTAFLAVFRERMASEPVVLAPQAREVPADGPELRVVNARRRSWGVPSAMAAGVVMVIGVTLLARSPGEPAGREPLALSSPIAAEPIADASPTVATVATGQLIRDARLDRYLAAHKQFAGSSALGIPSGFLRNATAIESER